VVQVTTAKCAAGSMAAAVAVGIGMLWAHLSLPLRKFQSDAYQGSRAETSERTPRPLAAINTCIEVHVPFKRPADAG
jgi:hypothetical protein